MSSAGGGSGCSVSATAGGNGCATGGGRSFDDGGRRRGGRRLGSGDGFRDRRGRLRAGRSARGEQRARARGTRREFRRNSLGAGAEQGAAMVGVAAGSVNPTRGRQNAFFHSRSVANASTASASGRPACACAAANTAGSAARRNGLVARSTSMREGTVGRPRSRFACSRRCRSCSAAIAGLDRQREAQVGERVFVPAIDERVARERGELRERRQHLRRRAFEDPAAAAGEQRVAGERDRRCRRSVPT